MRNPVRYCIMHGHDWIASLANGQKRCLILPNKHIFSSYNCNHKPHMLYGGYVWVCVCVSKCVEYELVCEWHKVSRSDIFQYFWHFHLYFEQMGWFESANSMRSNVQAQLPVGDGCSQQSYHFSLLWYAQILYTTYMRTNKAYVTQSTVFHLFISSFCGGEY